MKNVEIVMEWRGECDVCKKEKKVRMVKKYMEVIAERKAFVLETAMCDECLKENIVSWCER